MILHFFGAYGHVQISECLVTTGVTIGIGGENVITAALHRVMTAAVTTVTIGIGIAEEKENVRDPVGVMTVVGENYVLTLHPEYTSESLIATVVKETLMICSANMEELLQ